MQLFLEVLNDVLEFREIFRGRLDQGLVSFQHRLRPSGAVFFQRYWKSLPVLFYGAHAYVEKLVQPQATQRFRVSLIEIDDRQTAFAQLAKPQRDSSERAHKRRIHHRTIAQIDDELAGAAMDHLLGKVFQSRAVCGRTVALHPNPNDAIRTTCQYFRSRFHRFVSRGSLLQPQSKATLLLPHPRSPMIFRTGAGDSLINVGNYFVDWDSFAACTSALAKLSTFLSTTKAVTASFSAC